MAYTSRATHVEGSEYGFVVKQPNFSLTHVGVIKNGVRLVRGVDYKVRRREKYKVSPMYYIDFTTPPKEKDLLEFEGASAYTGTDFSVTYNYEGEQ